jgi:hypothetical protein
LIVTDHRNKEGEFLDCEINFGNKFLFTQSLQFNVVDREPDAGAMDD